MIFNWRKIRKFIPFLKKEDELFYPHGFGLALPTGAAKIAGINDKFNKEITVFYNGKKEEPPIPYTKSHIKALQEERGIPVVEGEFEEEDDDEVEYDSYGDFGILELKKVKV